jgi:glycosyltransferase involved in cell wall biosynthesis
METISKRTYKILMVAPQFKPLVGGYERAAERLSVALARRGHKVTVAAERRDPTWLQREACAGFEIIRLPCSFRRGLHTASALLSYAWFLIRHGRRYDLFHVHQYGYHLLISQVIGRLLNKPVVLKLTNTGPQGIGRTLELSRYSRALIATHRQVDACIATTQTALHEAVRFGIPKHRIYLIPNGLDVNYYAPCSSVDKQDLRRSFSINAERVVLYLGRLSEEKNPLGLLRAWAQICNNVHSTELVFVGSGPLSDTVKAHATSLGCAGSVRMVGDSNDVRSWYRMADIFVLPSRNEGLSNSLLEAMACGLPVISTRVSGSQEIFAAADVGELVENGDTDALANAMVAMLADEGRRKHCSQVARDYATREFSLDSVVEKVMDVYGRVLA